MSEVDDPRKDDALLSLAVRLADGEAVDWDSEELRTPDITPGIRSLRWLELIATAGRTDETSYSLDRGTAVKAEPISLAPGTAWGPLTILEKIGEGGAGDVFRAHDPSLQREVALKLWRETATRKTTGTEARRLAKVRHPGILAVHGIGRHDGYAGMWTDMVVGKNLEEVLRIEGRFDVAEAARIGIALCDALGAMHRAGLVHRDVKTNNVMREPDGRITLMDFGSVKDLVRGTPESIDPPRGTPLSMAPEAFRVERIGPTADVYGLGVLLYRLVTAHYPIEATTVAELIEAHGAGRAVPLPARRTDLPASFVEVVQRALEADPERRLKNMDVFRRGLEKVRPARAGHFWRVAGWVSLAAAAIVAIGTYWPFWPRETRLTAPGETFRHPVLVADFAGPEAEPAVAVGARRLVMAAIDQSDRLEAVASDQLRLALELAGKPESTLIDPSLARELAFRNGIKIIVEGRIDRLGRAYSIVLTARAGDDGHVLHTEAGRARDADALIVTTGQLTRQLRQHLGDRAATLPPAGSRSLAATPSFDAYKQYAQAFELQQLHGEDQLALELLYDALALDPDFAEAWALKGLAHGHLGEFDSARAAFAEALKRPQRLTGEGRLYLEGLADFQNGNLAGAEAKFRELIRRGYQLSRTLGNHGAILHSAGRYREARDQYLRAMDVSPVGPYQWVRLGAVHMLLLFDEITEARTKAEGLRGLYADQGWVAIAVTAGEWDRADSLATAFERDPTRPNRSRLIAAHVRGALAASRGSLREARADLARANQPYVIALLDLASGVPSGRLSKTDPLVAASDPFTRGLAAIARGDLAGARRGIADFDSSLGVAEPAVIAACIAGREGRWDEAARRLAPWSRLDQGPQIWNPPIVRWFTADAFEKSGQPDSAVAAFERMLDPSRMLWEERLYVRMLAPLAHLRLARIHAQAGRPAEAARHRETARQQLTHADPEVRQLLSAAGLAPIPPP